jgi:hypothetical protein
MLLSAASAKAGTTVASATSRALNQAMGNMLEVISIPMPRMTTANISSTMENAE